ncbi:MAG TPA: GGDEF domain-containing protein [Beijerinckiaceae bacterium]
MHQVDRLLNALSRQPQRIQVLTLVGIAIVAADALTLLFYSIFFYDRLLLDLALTTLIVVIVGVPLASLFVRQHARIVRMAEDLQRLSDRDGLTDLLNRRAFHREAALRVAAPGAGGATLLFIDCDHFKAINDTLGHAAGDRVLRAVAQVIRAAVGDRGLSSRMGGEEFGVLLIDTPLRSGLAVAETIRRGVADLPRLASGAHVTVSIGAAAHEDGQPFERTFRAADERLYQAKLRGRDQVVGFDRPEAA